MAQPVHDKTLKHYSCFDALDKIATSSPELGLACNDSQASWNYESIKRLSTSLQNLISQQHGMRHLPELPVPTYDNGNVDLTLAVVNPALFVPILENAQERRAGANPRNSATTVEDYTSPRRNSGKMSDARRHMASPQPQDLNVESGRCSRYIKHESRGREVKRQSPNTPIRSVGSTSIGVETPVHENRPWTARSSASVSRARKLLMCFEEQRYVRGAEQGSCRRTSSQPDTRRRLRLKPSFMDLRTGKRHQMNHTETRLVQSEMHPSTSMLSLREALQGGISPPRLSRGPRTVENATRECRQLTSLNVKPSTLPFLKPFDGNDGGTTGLPQSYSRTWTPPLTSASHSRAASDTISVSTSILDLFPEPDSYQKLNTKHIATNDDLNGTNFHIRPDSQVLGEDLRDSNSLGRHAEQRFSNGPSTRRSTTSFKARITQTSAPSQPPEWPLPHLPRHLLNSQSWRLSDKTSIDEHLADRGFVDATKPRVSRPATLRFQPALCHNRARKVAASKHLCIDSSIAGYAQNDRDVKTTGSSTDFPMSPFTTRSDCGYQSINIHDVQKKHISQQVRDRDRLKVLDVTESVRRGSAPDVMQFNRFITSADEELRDDKDDVPIMRNKPLPAVPLSSIHSNHTGTKPRSYRSKRAVKRLSGSQLLVPVQPLRKSTMVVTGKPHRQMSHGKRTATVGSAGLPYTSACSSATDQSTFQVHRRGSSCLSRLSTPRSGFSTWSADETNATTPAGSVANRSARSSDQLLGPWHGGKVPCNIHDIGDSNLESISSSIVSDMPDQKQRSRIAVPDDSHCLVFAQPADSKIPDVSSESYHTAAQIVQKVDTYAAAQAEFDRLNHELQQMKRVYEQMNFERQILSPVLKKPKSYAELLEDDRKASMTSQQKTTNQYCQTPRSTGSTIAKLEADLEQTPPSAKRDSDNNMTPSRSVSSKLFKTPSRIPSELAPCQDNNTSFETAHDLIRSPKSMIKSRKQLVGMSTIPPTTAGLPFGASQSTIGQKGRHTPSIVSKYSCFLPRTAAQTSLTPWPTNKGAHLHTGSGSRSLHRHVAIESEIPIDYCRPVVDHESDPDFEVTHCSTDTKQMDCAIDQFVSSGVPDLHVVS